MIKYLILIIIVIGLAGCALAMTIFSSTRHLQHIYGIQNIKTGKGLRPYNAYWWTGNPLILHKFKNWKCMTWQFTEVEKNTYRLRNLSTKKSFEAITVGNEGSGLWQQQLKTDNVQYWEFLKQTDSTFLIRQKGTELYLTISSEKENSAIQLMPKSNSAEQLWRLIEQHPWK